MTKFRQRYLFARSEKADDPSVLLSGKFDLAMFAPSWDRRCLAIIKAPDIQIDQCIVLRFSGRDHLGLREIHEIQLIEFLKPRSRNLICIDGDAVDLDGVWEAIWSKIKSLFHTFRSDIKTLIDLSTCPRYYSLGTLAGLLRHGIAQEVCVFYAEGKYPLDAHPHPLDYPFGIGQWRAVAIPFLEGMPDPIKKKYFVVSVGFEGTKTGRVLAREDPDRISILFPDPGSRPGYVEQTLERNRDTIKEYQVPDDQIFKATAGDAIMAWRELARRAPERPEMESSYYLCCGTKPHSLAFALRAICLHHPTVLYNLPEKHNFIDVHASGSYWTFRIQDLSVVPTERRVTEVGAGVAS